MERIRPAPLWTVLALYAASVALAAAPAHAQVVAGMVNSIPDAFQNASAMEPALRTVALQLFGFLVVMELAFALGMLWMDGQASTPNILALFVKQGVLIGLFALFIEAGPTICREIFLWMVRNANAAVAAMGGSVNMSPGDIIGIGANMVQVIWDSMSWSPKSLVLLLCGAIVIWTFAEIVGEIILVTIRGYLFAAWSALMMGFGGSAFTREIAIGQLRLAFAIGTQRFILQCIVGVGEMLMNGWAAQMRAGAIDYPKCIGMVAVSLVLWRLAKTLPGEAHSLITGAATGMTRASLAGAVRDGIMSAAKAGVGTAAMGGGIGAAFDQAKAQLEATSGKGGSGGGSSYPGSSLGGQIANGAKLAAMTARNMGEAYASDVGRRLSGAPGASAGFLGARIARHSGGAAASTRGDTAARNAARAAEPAYDP